MPLRLVPLAGANLAGTWLGESSPLKLRKYLVPLALIHLQSYLKKD